jgi:cytochrome c553
MRTKNRLAWALAALLAGAGCSVQWQNTQPAQAYAEQTQQAGSVYTGWRVFQDKCTACHGPQATGTAGAPDLLPRVREMGPRRFVGLVLARYDLGLPPDEATRDREALVDRILQRQQPMLTMPAWQAEPRVNAHILDLYAYLSARADGSQGPGRPAP